MTETVFLLFIYNYWARFSGPLSFFFSFERPIKFSLIHTRSVIYIYDRWARFSGPLSFIGFHVLIELGVSIVQLTKSSH